MASRKSRVALPSRSDRSLGFLQGGIPHDQVGRGCWLPMNFEPNCSDNFVAGPVGLATILLLEMVSKFGRIRIT
jgi:hypothetical protein